MKKFNDAPGFALLFMTVETGSLGLNIQCCRCIVLLLEPVKQNCTTIVHVDKVLIKPNCCGIELLLVMQH
jgi:hypothetical protein